MPFNLTNSKPYRYIEPRWLRLKDAMAYSAIGRDRLKTLVRNGEIVGFHDGGRNDWIFDRLSIDAYRLAQCADCVQDTDQIALEVLNR